MRKKIVLWVAVMAVLSILSLGFSQRGERQAKFSVLVYQLEGSGAEETIFARDLDRVAIYRSDFGAVWLGLYFKNRDVALRKVCNFAFIRDGTGGYSSVPLIEGTMAELSPGSF